MSKPTEETINYSPHLISDTSDLQHNTSTDHSKILNETPESRDCDACLPQTVHEENPCWSIDLSQNQTTDQETIYTSCNNDSEIPGMEETEYTGGASEFPTYKTMRRSRGEPVIVTTYKEKSTDETEEFSNECQQQQHPFQLSTSGGGAVFSEISHCDEDVYTSLNFSKVPSADVTALNPSPPMTIRVQIKNTDRVCHALIDTGSCSSFIQEKLINQLSLPVEKGESKSVKGLGDKPVPILGFSEMELSFSDLNLQPIKLRILPSESINYSIILGRDFLRVNKLIIDATKRLISQTTIDGGMCQVYTNNSFKNEVVYYAIPVYASEKVKIGTGEVQFAPVETKCFVNGKLPDSNTRHEHGSDLYYDGRVGHKLAKQHLAGVEGVLKWSGVGTRIMLMKTEDGSNKSVTVNPGDLLGTICTVVDMDGSLHRPANGKNSSTVTDWTLERIKEEITLGSSLDQEQRQQVHQLLLEHSPVLSQGDTDIGIASVKEHKIKLYDNTPIRQKPRRFPDPIDDEVERQCQELKEMDIIEDSHSPWSSPIVPIRKKDGTLRLCIDYRAVNKVSIPERFPMPNLGDLVFSLHGTQYFTCLDLVRGYYQVPLEKDSREITAFSTSRNHYQFKRLCFGLQGAPGAFQRDMQEVLQAFGRKQVLIYIDDILIMERDFNSHLQLVSRILETFKNHGIKIKPQKCSWFQTEVSFLGHTVGRSGIKKADKYVSSVANFPQPETVGDLRQFLGLVNFQRKFISNCSSLAKPLSRLTGGSKKRKIIWTEEMDRSFRHLKEKMKEDLELAYPNYSLDAARLELSTDASGVGAGACLAQEQDGERRVIAYASMSFSQAQLSYSTIEKELAAIRWAVKTFKPFIYGIPFDLFTDHRPLTYMYTMSRDNPRVLRTLNELSNYDFEVHYRPGKNNVAADIMSRLPKSRTSNDSLLDPHYLPPGLHVISQVEGGGDAMIHSLHSVLKHYHRDKNQHVEVPANHHELRLQLVDELKTNLIRYDLRHYKARLLKQMAQPGQPLLTEALLAFAKCYQLDVWVHHGMDYPVIYSTSPAADTSDRVHLQCLANIHYNPVRETSLYSGKEQSKITNEDFENNECSGHLATDYETDEVQVMCTSVSSSNCMHNNEQGSGPIVHIDEMKSCSLLDTGAPISIITNDIVKILLEKKSPEIKFVPCDVTQIMGIGRNAVPVLGIATLDFSLSGVDNKVTGVFAVVPSGMVPCCVILGLNLIEQLKMEINFETMNVTVNNNSERYIFPICLNAAWITESGSLDEACSFTCQLPGTTTTPTSVLLTDQFVQQLQEANFVTKRLKNHILERDHTEVWRNNCLQRFKRYSNVLKVCLDILYYEGDCKLLPVVPFTFLVEIILTVHWHMAHIGRHKLVHAIQQVCWHPSIEAVARDVTSSCPHCQIKKIGHQTKKPPTLKIETSVPFELVGMDLIQLPKTQRGHLACLVVVDYFSKWLTVVPLKNKQAKTVAGALESRVLPTLPRCPDTIITDNGPEFRSELFNKVLQLYGVDHTYTTPYSPGSAGAVERSNRTISELLRSLVDSPSEWDNELPKALIVYNSTMHSSINMSPSECLLRGSHELTIVPRVEADIKENWACGHPGFAPFKEGQKVVKKIITKGRLVTNKMKSRYWGPFEIITVHKNSVTYEIMKLDEPNKGQIMRAHHVQLKPFIDPPSYLIQHHSYAKIVQPSKVPENTDTDSDNELIGWPVGAGTFLSHSDSVDGNGRGGNNRNPDIVNKTRPRGRKPNQARPRRTILPTVTGTRSTRVALSAFPCSESCRSGNYGREGKFLHSTPIQEGQYVEEAEFPPCSEITLKNTEECSTLMSTCIDVMEGYHNIFEEVVVSLDKQLQEMLLNTRISDKKSFSQALTQETLDHRHKERVLSNEITSSGQREVMVLESTEVLITGADHTELFIQSNGRQPACDFSGFENSTEILKRILHSTPARLESLPNINLGKDQSSKFSGFASPTSPPQRSYRVRNSLSPIKQCLSEARDRVEQARRSSRLRIQMLKRVINASQKLEDSNEASDRPGVATPDINSIINLEEARQTRSSGPVPDYPNVQRKIMERRGNQ